MTLTLQNLKTQIKVLIMRQRIAHARYGYQPIKGLLIDVPSHSPSRRLFTKLRKRKSPLGEVLYPHDLSRGVTMRKVRQRRRLRWMITGFATVALMGGWYINSSASYSSSPHTPLEKHLSIFKTLDFSAFAQLFNEFPDSTELIQELPLPQRHGLAGETGLNTNFLSHDRPDLGFKHVTRSPQFDNLLAPPELEPMGSMSAAGEFSLMQESLLHSLSDSVPDWTSVTVKAGDNLSSIFGEHGLNKHELHKILSLGEAVKDLRWLQPGQKIRIRQDAQGNIETLIKEIDFSRELHIRKAPDAELGYVSEIQERDLEVRHVHAAGQIDSSLFTAGQQAGLSDRLVLQLVQIFGWDIDFALDIQPGDSFSVIYEEFLHEGKSVKTGEILAARFANEGHVYQSVRYTDSAGYSAYYTPAGASMQKAFLRTPVKVGRISSTFNPRRKHPILNKIRAHKGVDYAAPTGTPVYATGNGRISSKGWSRGYGKTIEIQHGDKYSTLYGHLSGYAKDLKEGERVRQGDLIGYVGRTGLATGPHLHYEFRVDGLHKNPLTVTLPKALPLDEESLADFKAKTAPVLARLDRLSNTVARLDVTAK